MRSPTLRTAAWLTLAIATPCAAQSDTASSQRWCWRGRPVPQCDAFWITESGGDFVVSTTTERAIIDDGLGTSHVDRQSHFTSRWSITAGPMFNRAALRAVGGTISVSPLYNRAFRVAAELRHRWWTPEGSALDLTIGPVASPVSHVAPRRSTTEYGLTTAAYLVGGDVINLNVRADLLLTGSKPMVGTTVGMGLGSRPAAYGTIIAGILIVVLIASYAGATS